MKNLLKAYQNAPKLVGVASNFTFNSKAAESIRNEGEPRFFEKPISTIFQHENGEEIPLDSPEIIICEIELAAVISKPFRNLPKEKLKDSLDYVGGYYLSSDLTCRRFKPISEFPDIFYMKNWENLTPVSDFIEKEKIPNPNNVQFELKVTRGKSGKEEVMEFNSKDFIWSVEEQLRFVSGRQLWNEGDVLLTGAPVESPQIYDGDVVEAVAKVDGKIVSELSFKLRQENYIGEVKED